VSSATTARTRLGAPASVPSTSRNALVSAKEILFGSNGVVSPVRRITGTPRAAGVPSAGADAAALMGVPVV
jgi:hypothetical protein